MNRIERRIERLEEIANPTLSPEEQRRREELARQMAAGRARVMADPNYVPRNGRPDFSDIPPLPNGKENIVAILNRWISWHKQQRFESAEGSQCQI